MANEPKNPSVAPAVVEKVVTPALGSDALNWQLSDAQFTKLLKAITYGFVVMGIVNNQPAITPSPKNLERVKLLGDAVLEMVGE